MQRAEGTARCMVQALRKMRSLEVGGFDDFLRFNHDIAQFGDHDDGSFCQCGSTIVLSTVARQ